MKSTARTSGTSLACLARLACKQLRDLGLTTPHLRFASQFQTQSWMDSVLGYPLYYGIVDGFGTPNGNMSGFVTIANQVLTAFPVSASIYMIYGAGSLDLN